MGGIYLGVKVAAEYALQTRGGGGVEVELHSFVISLLFGVGGHHQLPTTLSLRKNLVPTVQQAGCAPGLVYARGELKSFWLNRISNPGSSSV
jgi:hypothetical protein